MEFSYGTAGFRHKAELINEVVRRTAYLAAARARNLKKTLGIMITASHNPAEDNGVKVIDYTGRMVPLYFERHLNVFVNAKTWDKTRYKTHENDILKHGKLVIGGDTRESTLYLINMAVEGCKLGGVHYTIYDQYTTPQIHFIVYAFNHPKFSSHKNYVERFKHGFSNFMKLCSDKDWNPSMSYIDCANGVAALWLDEYLEDYPHYKLFNVDTESKHAVNHMCGADFVKIHRKAPCQYSEPLVRFASVDGDADRLVYYYTDKDGKFHLLDGDHIAALFAIFIAEMLRKLTNVDLLDMSIPELSFGIVQTAYANGNSTRFFEETTGVLPVFVNTGVKNLEEAAHRYDIGIYSEANGHGTVCFSSKFHKVLLKLCRNKESPPFVKLLYAFTQIVNEVVGDGIANYMAVECLLRYYNWSIVDWESNTYTDFPSYQIKVPVVNKELFQTGRIETTLISPLGIQQRIEEATSHYDKARAFVRPSGTEPIVRVYAEAQTDSHAYKLAKELEALVLSYNS